MTTRLRVAGAGFVVDRFGREAAAGQFLRELVVNAIEAGARRVVVGAKDGHLYVADDGVGMTPDDLVRFTSTLGIGSKPIGGPTEHFGVGGRVTTLPWNPRGVRVSSWAAGAEGATVTTRRLGDDYVVTGPDPVPGDEPRVAGDTGTVVTLLGSDERPDTSTGHPDQVKSVLTWLRERFWRLPVTVAVETGPDHGTVVPAGDALDAVGAAHGTVDVAGAVIHWYLAADPSPATGWTGFLYDGEVYTHSTSSAEFLRFGIVGREARERAAIVVEPDPYDASTRTGAFPDTTRSRLLWAAADNREMPVADWASQFRDALPPEIVGLLTASEEDAEKWKNAVRRIIPRFRRSLASLPRVPRQRPSRAQTPRPVVKRTRRARSARRDRGVVGIPDVRWESADAFDELVGGYFLPGKPGVFVLNRGFTPVVEACGYWQERYPQVPAERVARVVEEGFGVLVVSHMLHGSTLLGHPDWGPREVEDTVLSPRAISSAMLGVSPADYMIGPRLSGRFGAPAPGGRRDRSAG